MDEKETKELDLAEEDRDSAEDDKSESEFSDSDEDEGDSDTGLTENQNRLLYMISLYSHAAQKLGQSRTARQSRVCTTSQSSTVILQLCSFSSMKEQRTATMFFVLRCNFFRHAKNAVCFFGFFLIVVVVHTSHIQFWPIP